MSTDVMQMTTEELRAEVAVLRAQIEAMRAVASNLAEQHLLMPRMVSYDFLEEVQQAQEEQERLQAELEAGSLGAQLRNDQPQALPYPLRYAALGEPPLDAAEGPLPAGHGFTGSGYELETTEYAVDQAYDPRLAIQPGPVVSDNSFRFDFDFTVELGPAPGHVLLELPL